MCIQAVSNLARVDFNPSPISHWLEKKGFYPFSVPWLHMKGDVCRREHVSLEEAFEIANSNPTITHFVYVHEGNIPWMTKDKSGHLVNVGGVELYHKGEAVFFSGWNFNIQPCDPDQTVVSLYIKD